MFAIHGTPQKIIGIQQIASLQPLETQGLGVSKVCMSSNRSLVFAGHFDEQLRIYNTLSWREIFAFDHSLTELTEFNSSEILNIYLENESGEGIYYEALNRPFKIPRVTV